MGPVCSMLSSSSSNDWIIIIPFGSVSVAIAAESASQSTDASVATLIWIFRWLEVGVSFSFSPVRARLYASPMMMDWHGPIWFNSRAIADPSGAVLADATVGSLSLAGGAVVVLVAAAATAGEGCQFYYFVSPYIRRKHMRLGRPPPRRQCSNCSHWLWMSFSAPLASN